MSKTVVATVVFPANAEFISDFFDSLCRQTYKDFDVLIINDGFENFDFFIKKYSSLKIRVYEYTNSPAKIRQRLLEILSQSTYENIIFSDSDDYLADNRVARSLKCLQDYPIVFNDLTCFHGNNVEDKSIWASRFVKNKTITKEFLIEQNVLGLGNTAVRKEVLKEINIDVNLLAVDWAIFYTLIEDYQALFVDGTQTFYRQHDSNTIGYNKISIKRIKTAIEVKKAHYSFIKRKDLVNKIALLEDKLDEDDRIEESIKNRQIDQNQNYFWWEETKILENK